MYIKQFYFLIIFLTNIVLNPIELFGQIFPCQEQKRFLDYLVEKEKHSDILIFSKQVESVAVCENINYDSLNLIVGNILLHQNQYDSARVFYNKLTPLPNKLGLNAHRLVAYSFSLDSDFFKAQNTLVELKKTLKDSIEPIINHDLCYYNLLNRNLSGFDSCFRQSSFAINEENSRDFLLETSSILRKQKQKSPFIAGTLSAIIPGLGKVYSGRPYQGLSALMMTTLFAAQAFEGYYKNGLNSTRLYIYGSLFTIFYIGNIYGSAISVKIIKKEKDDQINHDILLNMRFALDDLF